LDVSAVSWLCAAPDLLACSTSWIAGGMMPDHRYTHGHHESVLRSHAWRTVANSAEYLIPELRPGLSVLDVGCGPGTITADLARIVAPGLVLGIDSSPGVLAVARQHAAEAAVDVRFEPGDIYTLELPDGAFDVVHAHQVLQHVPDPVGALREMRRLCAPNGVVAARDADYAAMTWYPRIPALDRWMALYQRVARSNGGEPDAGRRLLAWAHEAGFGDVRASASVWCHASPEERARWGGMWAERIVSSAMAEQAVADGLESADSLRELSDGWREWAADPDGWFVILHGEVLCRD
jgi:SAM-dependent methyltransferase